MTDLTKITTPFGLLDYSTKDKLADAWENGADIEIYNGKEWMLDRQPSWASTLVFRVKPTPVTVTLHRDFAHHGRHTITCNADGTDPTVVWEPDYV